MWLDYNLDGEYSGLLNDPWRFWYTYPSVPWTLGFYTRHLMHHYVDELYYINYYSKEDHSTHDIDAIPIPDAQEFIQTEVDTDSLETDTDGL